MDPGGPPERQAVWRRPSAIVAASLVAFVLGSAVLAASRIPPAPTPSPLDEHSTHAATGLTVEPGISLHAGAGVDVLAGSVSPAAGPATIRALSIASPAASPIAPPSPTAQS